MVQLGESRRKLVAFLQQKLMRSAEKMSNGPNVVETCVMNFRRKRRALYKIALATFGDNLTAVAVDNVTSTFLLKHQQHSLGLA
jgi:hypothetical protein